MKSPEMAGGEPPVDYDHLLDTYGLGPAELNAEVTFGNYTGTVSTMLTDPRCPVGGMMADAYRTGGIEAVEQKMTGLKALDNNFEISVSETTKSYHRGEIDRDALKSVQTESSDFLA